MSQTIPCAGTLDSKEGRGHIFERARLGRFSKPKAENKLTPVFDSVSRMGIP